jgi:hypothetical protein
MKQKKNCIDWRSGLMIITVLLFCNCDLSNNEAHNPSMNNDREIERYFTVEDLDDLKSDWGRNYISCPKEYESYYKSIYTQDRNRYTATSLEKIFDQAGKKLLEIEKVEKRVSLKKVIRLKRFQYLNDEPEYLLDTLPSKYLEMRNESIVDSLAYVANTTKKFKLCGLAAQELLEQEYPNSDQVVLGEEEGNLLMEELKKN